MSSNIRIEKKCQVCQNTFVAKTTKTLNCSDACAKKAYKLRKKNNLPLSPSQTSEKVIKMPIALASLQEIQMKQFLSIREVGILIGASRWTIYRLVKSGQLNVKRVGRKVIIKRSDVDQIFK